MKTWMVVCVTMVAISAAAFGTPPQPTSIVPNVGPGSGGTHVVIYGNSFTDSGTTTVTFGGAPATEVLVTSTYDSTYITCTTPPHDSGIVDVVVTNPNSESGTLENAFTYQSSVQAVDVADGHHVDVTFDGAMGDGVADPANYVLSGTGQGSLAANPDSVSNVSGSTYRLAWSAGDMIDGGDITITVSNVKDASGGALGNPDNGTDPGGGISIPPVVSVVDVSSGLTVNVTFSEAMGDGVTDAANYTISGTGKGTLQSHPTSAALVSGNTYVLTWSTGEMFSGGDITITVANAQDLAGNAIGTPNSGTDTGGGVGTRPSLSAVDVHAGLSVDATFSEAMGAGVTTTANYSISGSGKGTLSGHPNHVVLVSGSTYRMSWDTGEMHSGGDVTIGVANMQDPAGNPLGTPTSRTDTGGGIGTAPTVSSVTVQSGYTVDVTFSESLAAGATTPANYTLSGSGKGTLASHPDSAALVSGNTYRLTWNPGGDMVEGGDITITVINCCDGAGNALGTPNSGTHVGGGMFVRPTADAIAPLQSPINSPVQFEVTFSKPVQHFNAAGDVVITETGSVAHMAVLITGGPQTYTVSLTGVMGDGTATLAASTASDIQDLVGNALASSVMSAPATVDNTMPEVLDISGVRNDSHVNFTVDFSEAMQYFDGTDTLIIAETGTVTYTGASIQGGPQHYTVDLSGVSGDGTVTLAVSTESDVQDLATNPVDYSLTSDPVTVDNTAPSASAILPITSSPTNGDVARFSVAFSEPVQHFDAADDLVITETDTVAHSDISIAGGPQTYTVDVTGVTGDGNLSLAVNTNSDVQDAEGHGLASSVTSAAMGIDHSAPLATIYIAGSSITGADAIAFNVYFNEPVGSTFTGDSVTLSAGSLPGTIGISKTTLNYTVTVTLADPNANGSVGILLPPGCATDTAGNACPGQSSETCTIANWFGFLAQPRDAEIYVGDSVSFRVTPDCASPVMVYQWKWEDVVHKTIRDVGSNSPVYFVTNASAARAGDYWCEVTYDGADHPSERATLVVADHLDIAMPPIGGKGAPGSPYTFSVVTTGGLAPLEYLWKKDGVAIPDATDATYTIPSVTAVDAGAYAVEIADAKSDVVASAPAFLTLGEDMPVAGFVGLAALAAALALAGGYATRKR